MQSCLNNNDRSQKPHLLTMYLLNHDEHTRYYWSSSIHIASTMKKYEIVTHPLVVGERLT